MADVETASRGPPGGARGGPTRVPPRTPSRPTVPGRRPSAESGAVKPRVAPGTTPGSTRTPPPLPSRNSPSVFSGREGSTFPRRGETLASPPPAELELFAHHCGVFFWNEPGANTDASGDFISRTLARLPPGHRAHYNRIQSQLRAQAHLHHLRLRISSFHALIAANAPNSGLSGPARASLTGARAQAERRDRLSLFVRTWGGSAGALEPFFRGLWTAFRLQSRGGPSRSGAGPRRIVWEIDDAVFLESGGPEFMHEAVTILKGVLGFEEQPLSEAPKMRRNRMPVHSPSSSPSMPASTPSGDTRNRAGSDPFTDATKHLAQPSSRKAGRGPAPPPPPSRRRPTNDMVEDPTVPLLARSPNPNTPLTATSTTTFITSPGLDAPLQLSSSPTPSDDDDCEAEEADLNAARFRVWVFPARISDEEAEALMAAFPRYLKRPDARLPLARRRLKDLELASEPWHTLTVEGVAVSFPRVEAEDEAGVVRSGTGRMWVGTEERAPGWIGGRWFRFKRWWRRVFGRG